ncbi:MAG: DUF432 domain-containing protein [Methanomicrobiales archaeon]
MHMSLLFGDYVFNMDLGEGDLSIRISEEDGQLRYRREGAGGTRDVAIAAEGGTVTINPIEPLNLPGEITTFLEIWFDPLLIEPEHKSTIYLTFPIEIGVFVYSKQDLEILDIFSLTPPKYSLYGTPNEGVITRFHQSRTSSSPPEVDPCCEGILELTVRNPTPEWTWVSRAVFESYGMKIYYDDAGASMLARMKIESRTSAETAFYDMPLRDGMKKSIELYSARQIPVVKRVFDMGRGLVTW